MLLTFQVPQSNDRGPSFMNQVFKSLCGPLRERGDTLQVGIGFLSGYVTLYLEVPESMLRTVRSSLFAQYKQCTLQSLAHDPFIPRTGERSWKLHLTCTPDLFPLKRYGQEADKENRKAVDHLAALREMLGDDPSLPARLELQLRPAANAWRQRGQRCLQIRQGDIFENHPRLQMFYTELAMSAYWPMRTLGGALSLLDSGGFDFRQQEHVETSTREEHQGEHELQGASEKMKDRNLYAVTMQLIVQGQKHQARQAKQRLRDLAGVMGVFAEREARLQVVRFPWQKKRCLLSTRELATLWHPETVDTETAGTLKSGVRELEPPVDLPVAGFISASELTLLGETVYRDTFKRFGMLLEDRRLHTAILGKTGMGKTTLLTMLILSDIYAGRGVLVLDPHGDMIDEIIRYLPEHRREEVVLFDVTNTDSPLSYNLFDCTDPERAARILSDMKATFGKIFGPTAWGNQTDFLFGYAATVVMAVPGTSLIDVQRFLNDPGFRQSMLLRAPASEAREYWLGSFARKSEKFQEEMIAPLQNKLAQFTSSPRLRQILGQPKNQLVIRRLMNQGNILLGKLSKGVLGEREASLLGSFLITDMQISTLQRQSVVESQRRDCYLYIDEFENYCTESFSMIFSEARKYHLILTCAFQFIDQLDPLTRRALFGNVQNLISFQVGVEDAEILSKQLGHRVQTEDLLGLPRFHAYVRMLLRGRLCSPFLIRTVQMPQSRSQLLQGTERAVEEPLHSG